MMTSPIHSPGRYVRERLEADEPGDPAALRLAASHLAPGSLVGRGDALAFLQRNGIEVREDLALPPVGEIGTFLLVDSDGLGHRALRTKLTLGAPAAEEPLILDPRGKEALRTARRAAARIFRGPECDHRLDAAAGERWRSRFEQPMQGRSVGLALALGHLSLWLEQPIRVDLAASGEILEDGRLYPVDGIADKVQALVDEAPYVKVFLVPERSRIPERCGLTVIPVRTLADATRVAQLAPEHPCNASTSEALLDEALKLDLEARTRRFGVGYLLARLDWLHGRLRHAPCGRIEAEHARLLVLARLIEYRTHALRDVPPVEEFDALLVRSPDLLLCHRGVVARALNSYASGLIDEPDLSGAMAVATRAVASAGSDRLEEARARGTLVRVLAHALRDQEAEPLSRMVLEFQKAQLPREANITWCYRVGILVRLGQLAEARAELEAARAMTAKLEQSGWKDDNALYLDYAEMDVLAGEGRWVEVERLGEQLLSRACQRDPSGSWPQVGIIHRRVAALAGGGALDRAIDVLEREQTFGQGRGTLWTLALAHADVTARLLDNGRPAEASAHLERVLTACSQLMERPRVNGPQVDAARRILAGDRSAAALRDLGRADIY